MEIRRDAQRRARPASARQACPVVAAVGGVVVPALIYVAIAAGDAELLNGWAIPTATDIAFAVGVLALLGKSIPGPLRIFLLALAIIDDIVAVLIIAFFYSGGLDYSGFGDGLCRSAAGAAVQPHGRGLGMAVRLPGAVLWFGLLQNGCPPHARRRGAGPDDPGRHAPAPRHHLEAGARQALSRVQLHARSGDFDAACAVSRAECPPGPA